MKSRGLKRKRLARLGVSAVVAIVLPLCGSVHAAPPVITLSPNRARIQVVAAALNEIIDALSRAASFKVTYEGPRPTAMLFNAEIDTPSIPQTLFRVLEGQNLNYGVVLDPSGQKVVSVLILGVASKTNAPTTPGSAAPRPQPFATPRSPRDNLPPVDDDSEEAVEAENPEPEPVPSPPQPPSGAQPGGPASPFPPRSPFGSPFGAPFGPRPAPSPTPLP